MTEKLNVQGYQTAISRTKPPEPLQWLYNKGLIKGRALDYGSGRGCWYDMECYDPYWKPEMPKNPFMAFDTIVCNYVLNVVDEKTQNEVIQTILTMLKSTGTAYFSVRRDIPKEGMKGRGTTQRYVVLRTPVPFVLLSENSTRAIYAMPPVDKKRRTRIDVGVAKRPKTSKRTSTGLSTAK